jgi:uracil-DNA glycosylase
MPKPKATSSGRVVCFVGISGKPGANGTIKPLSEETLSGKIISEVEAKLRVVSECSVFVRDNLVQTPPLTDGKLRYPTQREMKSEWGSFERRLVKKKSNVIILLGRLVAEFFKEMRNIRMVACPSADGRLLKWAGVDENGLLVLAVAHPSYVGVYARKRIGDYAEIILSAVQSSLKEATV